MMTDAGWTRQPARRDRHSRRKKIVAAVVILVAYKTTVDVKLIF